MADFTVGVSNQVQSPVSPQGGVVDNSVASGLQGAGNVLSNIGEGLFGSQAVQARKAIEKGHEDNFISSYEQQQLKLANAVDQGGMSSDEARMRMRANYYKALSQFHGDPDDLARAHAAIVNTTGLGKIVETGTKKEQMQQALWTEAAKAGWIRPDMSDAEKDTALAHYQTFQTQQQLLQAQQAQVSYQRAQIGLVSDKVQLGTARIQQQAAGVNLQKDRIGLLEVQQQHQSRTALANLGDTYNYKFQSDLDDVLKQFDDKKIDGKQASMMINQKLAAVQSTVGSIGQNAGGDYINNLMTPMKMRADNALSYVNGDLDKKLLDNQNFKAEAVQKALILGDKSAAQVVAASSLFANAPFAVQKAAGDQLFSILKKNGTAGSTDKPADPMPHDDDEKSAYKDYLGTLKAGISGSLVGLNNNPEATDAEIQANLGNILRGLKTFSNGTQAKDYNDVVDFLADPQFGQYMAKKGKLPADVVGQAQDVIKEQYSDVVMPLLVQKYKETVEPMVGAANFNPFSLVDTKPVRDDTVKQSIHPAFNGSGVSFVSNDPADVEASKKAKKLNQEVAPVLNRLVRMSAHLNGGTDYKKAWETYYAGAFTPEVKGEGDATTE